MSSTARVIESELHDLTNSSRRSSLQRFFKTGPGEYGEGDIFLGLTVPQVRSVAARNVDTSLTELHQLLKSDFHELRLCALIILTAQFKKAPSPIEQRRLFDFYHKGIREGDVNNWDLIDTAAPTIGQHLLNVDDPIAFLMRAAKSKNLWLRRVSVLYTFAFIRIGDFEPTILVCEELLGDSHDLIHKAAGWALREVGKRNLGELRAFLDAYARQMPRTMLRYAIEKLPEKERKMWLSTSK